MFKFIIKVKYTLPGGDARFEKLFEVDSKLPGEACEIAKRALLGWAPQATELIATRCILYAAP